MSQAVKELLACPACGHQQDFTAWRVLNATVNPELKEQLVAGTLTRLTCQTCGKSAQILHLLLYHDMESAFMVWLIPRKADGSPGEMPGSEPAPNVKEFDDAYRFRVVDTMQQLIEKIAVFDAGLDDRHIELIKLLLLRKLPRIHFPDRTRVLLLGMTQDGPKSKLDFAADSPAGTTKISVTGDAMLALVEREFGLELKKGLPRDWLRIDARFAIHLLATAANIPLKKAWKKYPVIPRPAQWPRQKRRWWPF